MNTSNSENNIKVKKACTKIFSKALLTVLILVFSGATASSQGQSQHVRIGSNMMAEARVGYGFLITHKLEMEILKAHFPSFEISISKKTTSMEQALSVLIP